MDTDSAQQTARQRVASTIAATVDNSAAAVLCTGSTGRGRADQWSDLELLVLWRSPPQQFVRQKIATRFGHDPILFEYDDQERCWFDEWWYGGPAGAGLLVEITHVTLADADHLLDRLLVDFDAESALLGFASAVDTGRVLTGSVDRLTARVATYPRELATAVISRHGQIDHFWRWRMYVHRQDPHGLRQHFAAVVHAIVHVLCALNSRWWSGPKWPRQTLRSLAIKPERAVDRIAAIDQLSPVDAAAELTALVTETYELVRVHLPTADPDRLQRVFEFARAPWPAR